MSDDRTLLEFCNDEMDKLMKEVENGTAFDVVYDQDLTDLAEKILDANPNALSNFIDRKSKDE